jgi:predicted nucleic acid-binding protein
MLRYLLYTHIVIYAIKRRPLSALQLFSEHAGHMAISAITLAELMHDTLKNRLAQAPYARLITGDSYRLADGQRGKV